VQSRRPLLTLVVLLLLAAAGTAALGWEMKRETTQPVLREVEVRVPGLSREVTLLQVSDVHDYRFGAKQAGMERLLGKRRVDAAVLTGDMTDWPGQSPGPVHELVDVLRRHTGSVYYLRGNHDGVSLARDLATRGVVPLRAGTPAALGNVDAREAAVAYGIDDASISAIATATAARLLIVASHTPPDPDRLAAGAARRDRSVHLYICGHTHGGQIRLPLVGAVFAPLSWDGEQGGIPGDNEITFVPDLKGRLIDGMYEREGQRVFVSRGLGSTYFRDRLLCRSEMVLFRFVPVR
jgi:predicted MPP superfamily phosphohydrolase